MTQPINKPVNSNLRDCVFKGDTTAIRDIEDCIRASKKYSEGILMRAKHPIQGTEFPSRKFCKYYEVFPDMEISWDMLATDAIDWLWGDAPHIDITFDYDYRISEASMTVHGRVSVIGLLLDGISGLRKLINIDMVDEQYKGAITDAIINAATEASTDNNMQAKVEKQNTPQGRVANWIAHLTPKKTE